MGTGGAQVIDLAERRSHFVTQQSTVWSRRQQAVCVRRAYKRYGTTKNPNVILDGLNMTVPKGCIYGLLGASGCGKTTLLSCIVGRRRLNSGEIWVLGGKPGSRGSGVPGPRIGYMPQEIALYGEFTIRETMQYFGWVAGMETKAINERVEFLVKFLQLPPASRPVKNLSGGQQRRVSFAAALLHEPELLILDEPTVGVDPLLRQNIWDHLVQITKDSGTTVIITTHYIDETRQAHTIGLLRGGRMLAEESPSALLEKYQAESLEEVFLKLSILQNKGKRRRSSILHDVTQAIVLPPSIAAQADPVGETNLAFDNSNEMSGEFGDNVNPTLPPPKLGRRVSIAPNPAEQSPAPDDLPPDEEPEITLCERLKLCKSNHMKALVWKNFLWMWRNVSVMLFIIGLPVGQIILFCLAIGKDPTGLHLAVFNQEKMDSCGPIATGCNFELLSCRFLNHLLSKQQVLDYFPSEAEAIGAVQKGHAWAALEFAHNYTDVLKERMDAGRYADEWTVEESNINIWMDQSNQQISLLLKRDLVNAFQEFATELAVSCNITTQVVSTPIRFLNPIYGPVIPNFTDFAAPGVILTIIFFLAVALTSGAMLIERNEGIMERGLVSGITGIEILMGHVICQFAIMLFQSIMVIVFALIVFEVTNHGSVAWVALLTILTGLCGMCFGFFVSCITDSERNATYLAMGSFLPIVMLCGIIWPVEGMHTIVKAISFVLPLTLSTESLRCILARGWEITKPTVYFGFFSTLVWIVIFLTSSILLIKFKKG
nr:PREDICTED: ABC transporter G family member 20 [Bemisia tabaci]XP_018905609.1 PREDICTED: ABC transporter G family member 20 [Bemisia tabaci]